MCGNDNNVNCLADTFEIILMLQQRREQSDIIDGCDKPFLGPTTSNILLNTRPINIYSCCNNNLWTMPYTLALSAPQVFRKYV